MLGDLPLERHDLVERRLGDRRLVTPVDHGMRQVEQDVDDAGAPTGRPEQAIEQLARLRPDAGQVGRGREEGA